MKSLPLLCLLAAFAFAACGCRGPSDVPAGFRIENFVNRDRVTRIIAHGGGAVIVTTGGAYRLDLPRRTTAPLSLAGRAHPLSMLDRTVLRNAGAAPASARAIQSAECDYLPSERGLISRCPGADTVIRFGGFRVTAAAEFRDRIYVGTHGGGLRSADAPDVAIPGFPEAVSALATANGVLLCGTDQGLYAYDGRSASALRLKGPAHNGISGLDKGGGALWVATTGGGLSSLSSGTWRHWTRRTGLPSDSVDDIRWDGSRLWAAGPKGLFAIGPEGIATPQSPSMRRRSTGLFAFNGSLYFAQDRLIGRLEDGRIELIPSAEKNPQDLIVDRTGLWVAGLGGIHRLSHRRWLHYRSSDGTLPADRVTALARRDGGVLAGTHESGLAELDPHRGLHNPYRLLLRGAAVNARALAARDRMIALGAASEGLWLYYGGRWRNISAKDGLAGNDVTALLFDGPYLWVGTRSGLSRIELGGKRS